MSADSERDHGASVVDPPGSLMRAGAGAALWQGVAQSVGKATVLVTTIVLARLLAPEQFGLVSLALVLIAYAEAVSDAGVAQALVYLPKRAATTQAALACSLAFGCFLVAVAILIAPVVARLFGRADVAPLVRLLALSLLASSVSAVPEALLRRDLQFQRISAATVLRALSTGAVSIGLALAGLGAYALAWGTLAGAAVYATSTWSVLKDRPDLRHWRSSPQDVREVLHYGVPVASSSLLAKLIFDVDYLIIGAALGAKALAFYTLAFRLPELLIINVFFVLSTVTFPLYSRARSDPVRLRRGYLISIRLQSLYGVCAGVGLAVVAPLVVPLTFGAAWKPAVAPLVPLALYAACRSIGAGANEVYKALGRPGLSVVLSLARLAVLVPALLLASRWGILGVATAQLITSAGFVVIMLSVAVRVVGVTYVDLVHAVGPGLTVGGAVGVAALLLSRLPLQPVLVLVVSVAGGIVTAVVVLLRGFPSFLNDLQALRKRVAAA